MGLKISTYQENFMKIKVVDQIAKSVKEGTVNGIIRMKNNINNGIMSISAVKGENQKTEIIQLMEHAVAKVARRYRLFHLENKVHK